MTASGIIVLDKPSGLGSNRAMSALKRLLGVSKMGFLGTLDPLASGVLPVFVDKATRLIPAFEGLDKTYRVAMKFGERTDTFDAEGRIVETRELGGLGETQVRAAILSFQGTMEQEVPSYSAAKFGGTPAYRLARQGRPVPRRTRTVQLKDMAVEDVCLPRAEFRVTCSAGAYMRRLVEDIGLKTGAGGHVTGLRRISCGSLFTLENSITLEGIEKALQKGERGFLCNPSEFMPEYLPVTIEEGSERKLKNGQPIPLDSEAPEVAPATKVKAVRPEGTLIAIGEAVLSQRNSLIFRPRKVLI
jgi:tRNA pseudouridine55 synthase